LHSRGIRVEKPTVLSEVQFNQFVTKFKLNFDVKGNLVKPLKESTPRSHANILSGLFYDISITNNMKVRDRKIKLLESALLRTGCFRKANGNEMKALEDSIESTRYWRRGSGGECIPLSC
jgi:hypothetical protein